MHGKEYPGGGLPFTVNIVKIHKVLDYYSLLGNNKKYKSSENCLKIKI
jgi:hypothetical protein